MKYSRRTILFDCACFQRDCSTCKLADVGCGDAPTELLAEEARKHYLQVKNGGDWEYYDEIMSLNFGKDYAKEFMLVKARVV